MHAITIGLDIAKSVFQVHGEDAAGRLVFEKRLRRSQVDEFFPKLPRCVVGDRGVRLGALLGPDAARRWAMRCG